MRGSMGAGTADSGCGLKAARRTGSTVHMSIDAPTVRKIARLARLRLDEGEVEPLAGELSHILLWIEQLGEVDITGVEPMTAVMPITLRWREDVVSDGGQAGLVLANAPDARHGFFAVPKVIE